jgi:predicted Rossmann fold flavoprotein
LKKLIVIGGGAAGFFCAVTAARLNKNLQVTLLEKTSKLLSKVRISGGGRCNVTHALFDIDALSRRYPRGQHFVKRTFHQFSPSDTINWFAERGVQLKTEKDGRMFPVTDTSETIIDCLMREAKSCGVEIRQQVEVKTITRHKAGFAIEGSNGFQINADYVCIACGGYPKTSMFEWLTTLGHTIAEPVPSLFTFNMPKHPITALMGVSVPHVKIKIEGSKLIEEGPVLITHWGLSGPAVLRLSAWGRGNWHRKTTALKRMLPGCPAKTNKR